MRIGRYRLGAELGRGGMGRVWRAHQEDLDREVALKTLRAALGNDLIARERFRREGVLVARLRHPGIVTIHEVGEADGELFLAMELVDGPTLADRLKAGPMGCRDAVRLVHDLAAAVQHAHEHGVIHRDLKPSNVLLDGLRDHAPRLTDFGIARLVGKDESALTQTLEGIGTLAYLAPEQAGGSRRNVRADPDPATDVYGLGAVFYHCLTGRAPFLGDTPATVLRLLLEGDVTPVRSLNPAVPPDLENICRRCLEKEPNRRYPTAAALQRDLQRWLRGEPVEARPLSSLGRTVRWCQRHPAIAIGSVTTLMALVAGLGTSTWQWLRADFAAKRLLGELTRAQNVRAAGMFEKNEPREAIALLADTLRRNPADHHSAARLTTALTQAGWPAPLLNLGPHPGHVLQGAWSPDGATIVTAAADGRLRQWRAHDGVEFRCDWSHGPGDWVSLEYSPTGRWLGSLLTSGSLRVWTIGAANPALELGGTTEGDYQTNRPVAHFQFHHTEPEIAILRYDHTVETWAVDTGGRRQRWESTEPLAAIEYSPDGRWLGSVSTRGSVRVWSRASAEIPTNRFRAGGPIRGMSWHPNGRWLALTTQTNNLAEVWDWPEANRIRAVRHQALQPARFTASGGLLTVAPGRSAVVLQDIESERSLYRVGRLSQPLVGWILSPDGRRSAGMTDARQLAPFAVDDGTYVGEPIPLSWVPEAIAFSPDGERLLICGGTNTATVWSLGKAYPLGRQLLPGPLTAVQFQSAAPGHPPALWTLNRIGQISQYSLASTNDTTPTLATRSTRMTGHRNLARGEFSTDARLLVLADGAGDVALYDPATAKLLAKPWRLPSTANAVALSPDQRWIGVGLDNAYLALIALAPDHRSGRVLEPLRPLLQQANHSGGGIQAMSVKFSPDSTEVAVSTHGGQAATFSLPDGQLRLDLRHVGPVAQVGYSPDGRWLATACFDAAVRLWDAKTGIAVGNPLLHDYSAHSFSFSPDSRQLATAGEDHHVRVWEIPGCRLVAQINTEADTRQVAFSASGPWLVAAGGMNTSRLWDPRVGLPLTEQLRMTQTVNRATLSADGAWVALWESRGQGFLFTTPLPSEETSAPPWLPELAEAIAGKRYTENGELRLVSPVERVALETRLRDYVEPDPYWNTILRQLLPDRP